jgi:hypothetical protein
MVQFGGTASFTIDVSLRGFCLGAMKVLPKNSKVEGFVRVDGGMPLPFEGRVAWVVPGDRRLSLPGKMGVALTEPLPALLEAGASGAGGT